MSHLPLKNMPPSKEKVNLEKYFFFWRDFDRFCLLSIHSIPIVSLHLLFLCFVLSADSKEEPISQEAPVRSLFLWLSGFTAVHACLTYHWGSEHPEMTLAEMAGRAGCSQFSIGASCSHSWCRLIWPQDASVVTGRRLGFATVACVVTS